VRPVSFWLSVSVLALVLVVVTPRRLPAAGRCSPGPMAAG